MVPHPRGVPHGQFDDGVLEPPRGPGFMTSMEADKLRSLGCLRGRWDIESQASHLSTLEATQGQILIQSPTDATRFWWHLYGS